MFGTSILNIDIDNYKGCIIRQLLSSIKFWLAFSLLLSLHQYLLVKTSKCLTEVSVRLSDVEGFLRLFFDGTQFTVLEFLFSSSWAEKSGSISIFLFL